MIGGVSWTSAAADAAVHVCNNAAVKPIAGVRMQHQWWRGKAGGKRYIGAAAYRRRHEPCAEHARAVAVNFHLTAAVQPIGAMAELFNGDQTP